MDPKLPLSSSKLGACKSVQKNCIQCTLGVGVVNELPHSLCRKARNRRRRAPAGNNRTVAERNGTDKAKTLGSIIINVFPFGFVLGRSFA